jgi:hypothetical protein
MKQPSRKNSFLNFFPPSSTSWFNLITGDWNDTLFLWCNYRTDQIKHIILIHVLEAFKTLIDKDV